MKRIVTFMAFLLCSYFCISSDWITYTGKDSTFRISYPNQPEEQTSAPRYGNLGSKLITYNPKKGTDDNQVYWLNVTDYPPDKINSDFSVDKQEQFLKIQASVIIMLIGKTLSEENIELNSFKGKYMTGEILKPPAELHDLIYVKVYLVKSRLYQLMVSCTPDKKDNPSVKAFFDSFELLEK